MEEGTQPRVGQQLSELLSAGRQHDVAAALCHPPAAGIPEFGESVQLVVYVQPVRKPPLCLRDQEPTRPCGMFNNNMSVTITLLDVLCFFLPALAPNT
jgi:hypothetical protein